MKPEGWDVFIAGLHFAQDVTWDNYIYSSFSVALIAGFVCVIMLVLMTKNIILGMAGAFTVALTLLTLVAWMKIIGWQYGWTEAFSLLLVTGIPIDTIIRYLLEYYECK